MNLIGGRSAVNPGIGSDAVTDTAPSSTVSPSRADPTRWPRARPAPSRDHHPRLARPRGGVGARGVRRHPGALHRQRHRGRAALAQGLRARLGDAPSTRCCRARPHPHRPRARQGQDRRPHPRDLPPDRPLAARLHRPVKALGENSIVLDCDVLQADGGTRTAAITGAYVALADAVAWGRERAQARLERDAAHRSVAAVSVGIIDGEPRLDLCYEEDVAAEVDMNVVCTGDRRLRRGAGHRRGRAVRPRRARRAARPRRRLAAPS